MNVAALAFPPIIACLWIEGTTLEGRWRSGGEGHSPSELVAIAREITPAKKIQRLLDDDVDLEDPKVAPVIMVLRSDPKRAVEMLLALEAANPGDYSVAANLGTACELAGDLELAKQWIAESRRRNSQAHHGTEWLHEAILDAKLRLQHGQEAAPIWEANDWELADETHRLIYQGVEYDRPALRDALQVQLEERLIFVKPPSPLVASLLAVRGMIEEQTGYLEDANGFFSLAIEYEHPDPASLAERVASNQLIINKTATWRKIAAAVEKPILLAVLVLLCVIAAFATWALWRGFNKWRRSR